MAKGPVLGVLSPFIGGSYYGDVLAGVARAAALAGSRVVAVQTLDAGSFRADTLILPEYVPPIAWDHAAGFVVIVDSVTTRHLEALRAAGKPLVLVGYQVPGFETPSVLADNGAGVREAVEHLIGHGHRRIAFAGYTSVSDVQERYDAYREALTAHGIEPDPQLFFLAPDSIEEGGEAAGAAMIASGLLSTAVVCGTDLNAIGVMRTLRANGYQLPRDQAIVGFDDIDAAAHLVPSLSSVRQLVETLGSTAVGLLLRQLSGEVIGTTMVRVPTTFIARTSCGCLDVATADRADPALTTARDRLAARLSVLRPPDSIPSAEDGIMLTTAAGAITDAVTAAIAGLPRQTGLLTEALCALYRMRPQPRTLTVITSAVQDFADESAPASIHEGVVVRRVAGVVRDVALALAQAQAQEDFQSKNDFRTTVSAQYEVSMDLLHSHDEDPRTLAWLARTSALAGCLGLWASGTVPADAADRLEIVGNFARNRPGNELSGPSSIEAFPPASVFAAATGSDELVLVVPVKVNASDWGLLAIAGSLETRVQNGRESMNQCAALLTVALDLRQKEWLLRRAAMHDALTGLPNRILLLEHLSHAVSRAKRNSQYRFAVLFLDLDGFKAINDTLGHSVGDELLVRVAERITGSLREADVAARFGGDEFVVLLDDIGFSQNVEGVASRLNALLARPFRLENRDVIIRASTGIAVSGGGETAEGILQDADAAMYRNKAERHAMTASAIV